MEVRKEEVQTDMARRATEEALNLYSRDRKKLIQEIKREIEDEQRQVKSTNLDDILNSGV